ncbi:uncharacterized protein N7477_004818 [Penicillium maclennaniae]|uniref:uncharacterized protein n=1 Tax=Penicillium maclennaniae TaxID=1343394 RepID=UPI00254254D3|nr:uncharacterized protein N7477_004818 [Penicillium maclennaniae]KAJ5674884.1 hypothetical protein N7477_004818 [Penicillium maclennaniae]
MRFDCLLPALLSLLGTVSAQTLSGLTFDGRDSVSLVWALDRVTSGRYDFYLCAGDESTGSYETLLQVISDSLYTPGDLVSFSVDPSVGGTDLNAYFLKVVPSDNKEQWSGFTSHFTLTNMTGTFSTKVSDALRSMQPIEITWATEVDTNILKAAEGGPFYNRSTLSSDIHDELTTSVLQFPTPTIPNELDRHELRKRLGIDPHNIPYEGRKHDCGQVADASVPAFPFSIATTYLPAPTVQYTDTAYLTWTTHSIENTAAPAAAPTLDKRMQAWLERWKD